MEKIHKIGYNKPLKENEIKKIEKNISLILPNDYKEFLKTYGYGEISGFLVFEEPDKDFFRLNFEDYLDLWELEENEKQIILDGVKVASDIDGDIVLLTKNINCPFVIMPRHSQKVEYFKNFKQVLENKTSIFEGDSKYLYFDSYYDYERKVFDLIINNKLDKTHIGKIHNLFIKDFTFDKAINGIQPIYIIKKIGGWICFDLAYKRSFSIKYQKKFEKEAMKIFDILKNIIISDKN